jgi:hypothetical protein
VVRDARKRGLPSLLILEDDVLFDPSFSEKFPVFVRGCRQTGTWSSSGPCIARNPFLGPSRNLESVLSRKTETIRGTIKAL